VLAELDACLLDLHHCCFYFDINDCRCRTLVADEMSTSRRPQSFIFYSKTCGEEFVKPQFQARPANIFTLINASFRRLSAWRETSGCVLFHNRLALSKLVVVAWVPRNLPFNECLLCQRFRPLYLVIFLSNAFFSTMLEFAFTGTCTLDRYKRSMKYGQLLPWLSTNFNH